MDPKSAEGGNRRCKPDIGSKKESVSREEAREGDRKRADQERSTGEEWKSWNINTSALQAQSPRKMSSQRK